MHLDHQRIFKANLRICVFTFAALLAQGSWAQLLVTPLFSISLESGSSTMRAPEPFLVAVPACYGYLHSGTRVDAEQRQIDLDFSVFSADFLCQPARNETIAVNGLSPGTYTVTVFNSQERLFNADDVVGSFSLTVTHARSAAFPETPTQGSKQSGVGLVRGWACSAESVEIQFDAGERIPVAYGTSRSDTRSICRDDNNGYGAVIAWGTLGKGMHRMKTFIDGVQVGDVEFQVSGFEEPFLTGLAGEYVVEDFPTAGESVMLRWSEANQNFIIVEHIEE